MPSGPSRSHTKVHRSSDKDNAGLGEVEDAVGENVGLKYNYYLKTIKQI